MNWAAIFSAFITNVVAPEISGIIRDHFHTTGEMPDDATIIAKMQARADRIDTRATAWLAGHPDAPAAPLTPSAPAPGTGDGPTS